MGAKAGEWAGAAGERGPGRPGPSQVWGLRLELGSRQAGRPGLALPFSGSRARSSPEGGDHSLAGGARADVARPREPGRWPWRWRWPPPAGPGRLPLPPASTPSSTPSSSKGPRPFSGYF